MITSDNSSNARYAEFSSPKCSGYELDSSSVKIASTHKETAVDDSDSPDTSMLPITEQDMLNFHAAHFPGRPPPRTFFVEPLAIAHLLPSNPGADLYEEELGEEEEEPEDDGLGYYPDGVKRTLTDEQIEIFRHSELIRIARQKHHRQQQQQQKEEDEEEREHTALVENGEQRPTFDSHVALYNEHLERMQETEPLHEAKARERARQNEVPYAERHKRRWEGYIEKADSRHGSMTSRRLARELDDQHSREVVIDYGDAGVTASSPSKQASHPRRIISYADD